MVSVCHSEWMKPLSHIPTLCDPMDYSLTGFSVHGIFQARVLEWSAIGFSNALFLLNISNPYSRKGQRLSKNVWHSRFLKNNKNAYSLWINFLKYVLPYFLRYKNILRQFQWIRFQETTRTSFVSCFHFVWIMICISTLCSTRVCRFVCHFTAVKGKFLF